MSEIEVFRIRPELKKCYEHAESTRVEGDWRNERHFTTNTPRYVGEYVRSYTAGDRDNKITIDYFIDDNGKENTVMYSYDGKTCFREVDCKMKKGGKSKRRRTRKNKKRMKTKRRNLKRK